MFRKHKYLLAYALILAVFSTYVMMDTFVITRVYGNEGSGTEAVSSDEEAEQSDGSGSADAGSGTSDDSEAGNQHSGSGSGNGGPGGHSGKGHGKGGHGGHSGRGPGHSKSGSSSDEASAGTEDSGSDSSDMKTNTASASSSSSASSGSNTYKDDNISITLKEVRQNDTTIYVADVQVKDPSYLKTALAQGAYGKNVTAKTSETAESVNAVLAINGDYYGAQEKGYVIRNGKLYRNTALSNQEDLVIYKDGSFGIINESKVTAEKLVKDGAVQVLSFGPALVQNGKVTVSESEEVGKAMASNPRTAIGIISENHYVFVVSDGRTSESTGLSLYQLAQFMDGLGVKTAYNLDGGGSSTMYFNGRVVNNPTTGGNTTKERSVSDIVYIG